MITHTFAQPGWSAGFDSLVVRSLLLTVFNPLSRRAIVVGFLLASGSVIKINIKFKNLVFDFFEVKIFFLNFLKHFVRNSFMGLPPTYWWKFVYISWPGTQASVWHGGHVSWTPVRVVLRIMLLLLWTARNRWSDTHGYSWPCDTAKSINFVLFFVGQATWRLQRMSIITWLAIKYICVDRDYNLIPCGLHLIITQKAHIRLGEQ